jgi:hypothetical protein
MWKWNIAFNHCCNNYILLMRFIVSEKFRWTLEWRELSKRLILGSWIIQIITLVRNRPNS